MKFQRQTRPMNNISITAPQGFLLGRVTRYKQEEGYGFVKAENGESYHFRDSVIQGLWRPKRNDLVRFAPSVKQTTTKPNLKPSVASLEPASQSDIDACQSTSRKASSSRENRSAPRKIRGEWRNTIPPCPLPEGTVIHDLKELGDDFFVFFDASCAIPETVTYSLPEKGKYHYTTSATADQAERMLKEYCKSLGCNAIYDYYIERDKGMIVCSGFPTRIVPKQITFEYEIPETMASSRGFTGYFVIGICFLLLLAAFCYSRMI